MKPRTCLAPLAIAAALCAAPVHAATIGFAPASVIAAVGDTFSVDVVVSDLGGEIVSAYDLDIVFDASVLTATSVVFSGALGGGAFLDAILSPGLIDVAGVSLLSDAALLALQGGDAVMLASIGFTKTGDGTSALDFVFDAVNDVKGANGQILALDAIPGSVVPIPEPSAALTFGAGLLVTGFALRRRPR
jgi:hypothetical protein